MFCVWWKYLCISVSLGVPKQSRIQQFRNMCPLISEAFVKPASLKLQGNSQVEVKASKEKKPLRRARGSGIWARVKKNGDLVTIKLSQAEIRVLPRARSKSCRFIDKSQTAWRRVLAVLEIGVSLPHSKCEWTTKVRGSLTLTATTKTGLTNPPNFLCIQYIPIFLIWELIWFCKRTSSTTVGVMTPLPSFVGAVSVPVPEQAAVEARVFVHLPQFAECRRKTWQDCPITWIQTVGHVAVLLLDCK